MCANEPFKWTEHYIIVSERSHSSCTITFTSELIPLENIWSPLSLPAITTTVFLRGWRWYLIIHESLYDIWPNKSRTTSSNIHTAALSGNGVIALKTCERRWTIGKSGERGSEISVLAAWHDDDDDDDETKKLNQIKLIIILCNQW